MTQKIKTTKITPKTLYYGDYYGDYFDEKFKIGLQYNKDYVYEKINECGLTPKIKHDLLLAVLNLETYNDAYYFYTKTGVVLHAWYKAIMIYLFQKNYLKWAKKYISAEK